jgi:OmpA-OmpF porin, OOP family
MKGTMSNILSHSGIACSVLSGVVCQVYLPAVGRISRWIGIGYVEKTNYKHMRNTIVYSLALLFSGVVHAQETGHYLKFDLGGGQHRINYSPENGTIKPGLGVTGNIMYNYFWGANWGLGAGVGLNTYKSTATINYRSSTPSVDTEGDNYDYRAYYSNWQECQNLLMLDFPLALNYRHQFGSKLGMLVSGGTKISFPVKSFYETVGGEVTTAGYYPQWDVELNGMPQHGFDTYNEFPDSEMDSKVNFSAYADLGALYKLSEKVDFYIGAYANYGLTDVSNAGNRDVYSVNDGIYNGVLASNQVSRAHLLSVGVKVGINLHLLSKNKAPKVRPVEEIYIRPYVEQSPSKGEIVKDTIAEETTEAITILAEEDEIEWHVIATQKASQIELHFDKDSDTPDNNQDSLIIELSEILKNNPDLNLLIIGHTCTLGSKEINQELGLKRANRVKDLFVEKGIPDVRITTESRGYSEPLVPNTSEQNRAINRRVDLKIAE